jgi:putative transposase
MLRKSQNDELNLKKYKTFGKSRSVRLRDFDYSLPYAYFVTVRCFEARDFFEDQQLAREVTDCLLELKSKYRTRIFTYCLMPNHLHLLLTPGERQASVPKFMQILKGKTTHIFWKCGFKGRLWQKSYYDHIMRSYEDLHEAAKYILNNPVRDNMVEEISEYPFSGIVDELPAV